ncbi:MAG TPA: HPr family phosphocarrier protein, partial [Campylobacterales bacterium]|nr:HPr family phosphocarrier protein [Campylobacterales bacterium]
MNFIKRLLKTKKTTVETTLTITSSNGFHLRPIAQFSNEVKQFESTITIVAKDQEVSSTQVNQILSLGLEKGDSFILRAIGDNSSDAIEYLESYFQQLMIDDKEIEEIKQEEESYESISIKGQTIGKGVAIAPIIEYETYERDDNRNGLAFREALKIAKKELYELYIKNKTTDEAQIFLAQQELLSSDIFRYGCTNIKIFRNIIKDEITKLENTRFESRISDYKDIEQRVLSHLGIDTIIELPNTPYILVAEDLLPSEIMRLMDSQVAGVILKKGTPTSHASILLRSFGVPSMIIDDIITPSSEAILDANSGNIVVSPTSNDLEKAYNRQIAFKAFQEIGYQKRFEPAITKDGKKINILANTTDVISAQEAKEKGADGIGLLRTEFLFQENRPTLEEQVLTYAEIMTIFDDITIRTLDVGGDKALPYAPIPKEPNPFLGIRGIRFSLQEQTLFREQLLGIFLAHNQKPLKVMFPMVSSVQEFNQAKTIAKEVAQENNVDISNIKFGIMLEVPCVIFALKEFDKIVDFYSIGTNDLTQYLFATERTHPSLHVSVNSPMLMSALKMIKNNITKPISICGELAGMEEVTSKLLDMGYDTLSVSAKLIPSLKERIR